MNTIQQTTSRQARSSHAIVIWACLFSMIVCGIWMIAASPTGKAIPVMLFSLFFSFLLIALVTSIFGRTDYPAGIFNYLIGDEGTYSLSRLQAVAWALVILSGQMAILTSLIINHNTGFHDYQPVFSETTSWLLGLSLSSVIAVKGLTVQKIAHSPALFRAKQPSLKDILCGDNGLDFSRCQMLIWTLVAIAVYTSNYHRFIIDVLNASQEQLNTLFTNTYESFPGGKAPVAKGPAFVPYIPWSFVVLMGLSQGGYVGKKLVPDFKMDEAKKQYQFEIQSQLDGLKAKLSQLNSLTANSAGKTLTALDNAHLAALQQETALTQQRISDLQQKLTQYSQ